jgi:hypothetical protein
MSDPWTFGWTQLLMIAGLALTGVVSILGLRTFGRWRRETIEERRIEAAVDAWSLAYQAEWIFGNIRAPIIYPYEYEEMPERPGEPEDRRESRGKYYAVLKRLERNSDFFKGVWSVQPRVMALFGAETERIFRELHEARRQIEVSAGLLYSDFTSEVGLEPTHDAKRLRRQQREDIDWAEAAGAEDGDRIAAKLTVFLTGMEMLCRPIVERGYR